IKVNLGEKSHTITLAEEPADTNRFTRPTYLRLDNRDEILRVAPGLIATLDRNEEYFRMRRLFPTERIAKEDSQEKVQEVAATAIKVSANEPKSAAAKESSTSYEIVKAKSGWEMTKPVHDRVEPDKAKNLLSALPNLWVESFVERKDRSLAELGL